MRAAHENYYEVRELWEMCFPDEPEFTELFFRRMYKPEYAYLLKDCCTLISMLHAFPYTLATPEGELSAIYIYGVGTRENARGRGGASKLIGACLEQQADVFMLIPQSAELFPFYEKQGFEKRFFVRHESGAIPTGSGARKTDDALLLDRLYERAFCNGLYVRRPEWHWEMLLEGGLCAYVYGEAYGLFSKNAGRLLAEELVFTREEEKNALLGTAATELGCNEYAATLAHGEDAIGVCRIKSERARKAFSSFDGYLNLMHN